MNGMCDIKKETADYRILHLNCNGNKIYSDDTKSNEAAVPASYFTLHSITKKANTLTNTEYVNECIIKVAEIFCLKNSSFSKASVFLQTLQLTAWMKFFFNSLNCILHQEAQNTKRFDNPAHWQHWKFYWCKCPSPSRISSILVDTESKRVERIYHINMRLLSCGSVLKSFYVYWKRLNYS